MPRTSKLIVVALLALIAACATSGRPAGAPGAGAVLTATILQINDVYEIMPLGGSGLGGLARVATLKKQLLREDPNTFMVLAGDVLSPSAMSSARAGDGGAALNGQHMVDIMNRIGLDYATFGNHEFDLRKPDFDKRMAESTFVWFSSNVLGQDGSPFPNVPANVVVNARGLRIGMFGLTIDSNAATYVRYRDPFETAGAQAADLKGKSDVIIALTHLSIDEDIQLAETVPGIAMVLGGHEHQNINVQRGNQFVPVLKADSNAKSAYVHRLRYDTQTRRLSVDSKLIEIDDSIPEDAEVAAAARAWVDKAFAAFRKDGIDPEKTVTTLTEMFEGREAAVRTGSTNLTRELNAAMIDAFPGADASIFNSGSIRIDDTLGPGPITQYDVLRVLPYRGDLFLTSMKGSLLAKILAAGAEPSRRGQGGWLQSTGVDPASIDPNRDYRVVINDYVLNGNERGLEWIKPETSGIKVLPDAPQEFRQAVIRRGLGAHRDVWNASAEALDDRYRLHLVQINGFGGAAPSANADGPVSAPVAEEIARYIRESRLDRPAVIGHSMGGSIAMMTAARHPDLPGRVMVVDMVPFMGLVFGPPGTTKENVGPRADAFKHELLTNDRMLDQMIPTMTRTEAARPVLTKYSRDSHRQTVANAFHELFVTDLTTELSRISAPLTVLYVVPEGLPIPADQFDAAIRQMYSTAPRAQLVKIENSNHYIQIDQSTRFVAEVDAFMKR